MCTKSVQMNFENPKKRKEKIDIVNQKQRRQITVLENSLS